MKELKNIKTELLSLKEIVSNHFFKIPDYQRGYSWEIKQLKDLRKDIENLYTKNYRHYTGTIVATEKDGSFSVVDGQQRLTTLIILINEANKILKSDGLLTTYLVRGELGREKYVLETNKETNQFFKAQILKNEKPNPQVKSHLRIRDTQKFFNDWFNEENIDVDKIVKIATEQFGFIFFSPQDSKEIGIMFEVINNRGKALSELEKIKNFFIYYASINEYPTFREEINSTWSEILVHLNNAKVYSNEEENRFLRNCYIVFFDINKSKSWHVYEQLKIRFNPNETNKEIIEENYNQINNFITFLKNSSLYYSYLTNRNTFNDKYDREFKSELSEVLSRLRCQPTKASILPLYFASMSYLNEKPSATLRILKLLEIVNFRVYLLPKVTSRTDSMQGDMFKWAYNLYNDRNWLSSNFDFLFNTQYSQIPIEGDIIDRISLDIIGFGMHVCPEKKFIQSLTIDDDEADDYYHWKSIRFFLASFEEFKEQQVKTTFDIHQVLNKKEDIENNNDFLSLEHIWASKNRDDKFTTYHKEKRRLGNFVLLGLSKNTQLSNNDIPIKIKELNTNDKSLGFGHMPLRQVSDLTNILPEAVEYVENNKVMKKTNNYYMYLSTYINDKRETEMINFALKRWNFPNENLNSFIKVDSFNRPNENENFHLKNIIK